MSKIIGAFTFHNEVHLIVLQIETMLRICDQVIALSDNKDELAYDIASSYCSTNFVLYNKQKHDLFYERDEQGDRQILLHKAKELGGNFYYYTDVDEIVQMNYISKMRKSILRLKSNEILSLRRYDLWGNAYNYRLLRDTSQANKIYSDIESPYTTEYVCSLEHAQNFNKKQIPNFHAERMPNFSIKTKKILNEEIKVIHYGYFNENIIQKKKEFYLTDKNSPQAEWGEDMNVNAPQYASKWGMGYLDRTHE